MTAASTPRLGLMSPVDSDLFLSSDFATTFALLDAKPGITFIDSYAGLAASPLSTWSTAQHGNVVLERDNGALWYWYCPSGSGSWKRANSVGLLKSQAQSAPLSTSLTTTGPTFIDTGNVVFPGTRAVRLTMNMGMDNSSGVGGIVIVTVKDNGSQIAEYNYRAGSTINSGGANHQLHYTFVTPTNNSTHRITATFRSATLSAASGGGGTSNMRQTILTLTED